MQNHIAVLLLLAFMTQPATTAANQSLGPVQVAAAFRDALHAGDTEAVLRLLAPEVLVYEFGGQEASRAEYAGQHMKGDMEFLANAQISQLGQVHGVDGDQAWVATRSHIVGTHKGKGVNLYSTETLLLKRAGDTWQIVHVHWSSRPVKKDD